MMDLRKDNQLEVPHSCYVGSSYSPSYSLILFFFFFASLFLHCKRILFSNYFHKIVEYLISLIRWFSFFVLEKSVFYFPLHFHLLQFYFPIIKHQPLVNVGVCIDWVERFFQCDPLWSGWKKIQPHSIDYRGPTQPT